MKRETNPSMTYSLIWPVSNEKWYATYVFWLCDNCNHPNVNYHVSKNLDYHGVMFPWVTLGPCFVLCSNLGCIAWLRGWENNQRDCVKNNSCHILSPQSAGRCFGILTGCRRCHATGHWPELTPGHQEGHWQHRSHWHLTEQFIDSSVPDGVCLNPLLICLHFGNV